VDPLVSCLLLTRGRGRFAALAVEQFLHQDYRPAELIVIDDGAEPVADLVCRDERVRYIRLEARMSAGARRNLACEQARGGIIVHWDDAVWHAPQRILYLLDGLLRAEADLCGLSPVLVYDRRSGEAWQVRYPSRARVRVDVSSLCYRRGLWERNRFPVLEAGECEEFLRAARRVRAVALPGPDFQVRFTDGFKTPPGLRRERAEADAVRRLLGRDWASYVPGAAGEDLPPPARPASKRPRKRPAATPLVSCIMLARGHRLTGLAIEYFLRQDYEPRELIVVDSGAGVEDLIPRDERFRYLRAEAGTSAGAQRNLACEQARGELIAHWDERDWQAPRRLRCMVEALLSGRAGVCWLNPSLACDVKTGEGWQSWCPVEGRFWGSGGSLCYRRSLWESARFPDADWGESLRFLWGAPGARSLALPDEDCLVSMVLDEDSGAPAGPYWRPFAGDEMRRILGADWQFYEQAPVVRPRARPTVSCILLTRDRRRLAGLAMECFLRQDYEASELIVIDDGVQPIEDLVPRGERFHYIRLARRTPAGAKRNLACQQACGDIILHWDENAWYAPHRIRTLAEPLLSGTADLCGLNPILLYDPGSGQALLHRQPPGREFWVHPSSLCYRRSLWEGNRFPELDLGEDIAFLSGAPSARRLALPDYGCQLGILSGYGIASGVPRGAWAEPAPAGQIRRMVGEDWHSYEAEAGELTRGALAWATAGAPSLAGATASLPLVSCVMPTANRRPYVAQAILYFQRQDYPNKELVILDDGEDSVADLGPRDPRIRYYRLPGQRTLGAKRNQCVEASRGDLILHWDDDDWMAPHRIRYQVEALLRDGAEVCGLPRLLFHEPASGRTWLYRYIDNFWLAGGSLLYTRGFWRRSPFPDMQVGSDTQFIFSQPLQRASFLPDYEIYVAMVHPGNTSPKTCGGQCWEAWPGDVRRIMGGDLDFYLSLARPQAGSGSDDRRQQWLDAVLRRAGGDAHGERAAGGIGLPPPEPRRAPATAPPEDLLDRENWHRWHGQTNGDTRRIPGIGVRAQLAGILVQLGETLLDLGCGPGALWRHLEPHRGRFFWTGVDLSQEKIAAAHRLFPEVPACRADAGSLPFPDRNFDVVLFRHLVELLPVGLIESALAEGARVARKALVLDFCGPTRAGANRIGALLANAGWRLRERFAIAAAREKDELWVFVPGSEQ